MTSTEIEAISASTLKPSDLRQGLITSAKQESRCRRIIRRHKGPHCKPNPTDFEIYTREAIQIDLNQRAGEDKWQHAIDLEKSTAHKILAAALADFPPLVRLIASLGGARVFGAIYRSSGVPYEDEIAAWARATKTTFGLLAMVNCAYELEQLRESFLFPWFSKSKHLGCTSAILEVERGEPVHVRTLDWPITSMGASTRLFEFKRSDHNFLAVSFPGAVGVLSGMVPGAYSVTINWAPPHTVPSLEFAPSLLLRKVLEECLSFDAAVERLTRTRLCTSVFYTVCGTRPGESCVVERIPDDYRVRKIGKRGLLVQTNHFDEPGWFGVYNKKLAYLQDDPLVRSTRDRRNDFEVALSALAGAPYSKDSLLNALDTSGEVTNFETCQRIIFRPAKRDCFLQIRKDRNLPNEDQ